MEQYTTQTSSATEGQFPSLTFQVDKHYCAISARCVTSIMLLPDKITPMPQAPSYLKGIMHVRGLVVPLVDMRSLFGISVLSKEYDTFTETLDARIEDHHSWVSALRSAIDQGEIFTRATNAGDCNLGQWLSTVRSLDLPSTITFHLERISEPHAALHSVAARYNDALRSGDTATITDCKERGLSQIENVYMPSITSIMKEAKDLFAASFQSIVIVIEDGGSKATGLIVDKVHAVETVGHIDMTHQSSFLSTNHYVSGIGASEKSEHQLLILEEQALLHLTTEVEALQI